MPEDRFVVTIGGRCYGKYRTREAALRKAWQVEDSRQPRKPKAKRTTPAPWQKKKRT